MRDIFAKFLDEFVDIEDPEMQIVFHFNGKGTSKLQNIIDNLIK